MIALRMRVSGAWSEKARFADSQKARTLKTKS